LRCYYACICDHDVDQCSSQFGEVVSIVDVQEHTVKRDKPA
jgi:hypothetical protein